MDSLINAGKDFLAKSKWQSYELYPSSGYGPSIGARPQAA